MERLLAGVVLAGVAVALTSAAYAQTEQIAGPQSAIRAETPSGDLPALPPVPHGKSTVLGGEIRNVDPVLDEFKLKAFGERPIKILFDERTQVYRDGVRIPLRDLRSADHASVQTVLDGTEVFALSIHMLSQAPEGDYQGDVLNYNPATSELTVGGFISTEPIKLVVPANIPIVREGQAPFSSASSGLSDLVKGSLVSVKFKSDKDGRGVASRIAILAIPGSAFVFNGNLATVDMHTGLLVLVDPRDERRFQIFFDSGRFPASHNLHQGDNLRVTASFDGTRYVASAIALN